MFRQLACLRCKMAMFKRVGNERGRGATPSSISKFDSYDIKAL